MAVNSYPRGATPDGVVDLAGNVAEWVEDVYAPYPASNAKPDPNCPGCRSYRGGAFSAPKERLKATYRWWDDPTLKFNYLGFRCAKDVGK
jgi:formylglycine-generating enzyme required for sulfatase activity